MGVNKRLLEGILLACRERALGDVVMIGRLGFAVRPGSVSRIFARYKRPLNKEVLSKITSSKFAEDLLRELGATRVDSIDVSDYQGASIIQDMSEPIEVEHAGKFDTLLDGGTIEHIFDVPQAMENYLNLLRVGGRLICMTAANNFCGHGFYQFSPEFWYSLFEANHCTNIRVFLVPTRTDAPWFEVMSPKDLKGRVEVINAEPTFVIAMAEKTADTPSKLIKPHQSDYENSEWSGTRIAKPVRAPMPQLARATRAIVTAVMKPFGRKAVLAFGLSDHPNVTAFDPAAD